MASTSTSSGPCTLKLDAFSTARETDPYWSQDDLLYYETAFASTRY